jgi:hypothetical protein
MAGDWRQWSQDGKAIAGTVDMVKKLSVLGAQGWELVSALARSYNASEGVYGQTSTICASLGCTPTNAPESAAQRIHTRLLSSG